MATSITTIRSSARRTSMRLPWVLADEHRHFAMLEVGVNPAAQHLAVHPNSPVFSWASAFERNRETQRTKRAVGIGSAELVSLPSAAVLRSLPETSLRSRRWQCPNRF